MMINILLKLLPYSLFVRLYYTYYSNQKDRFFNNLEENSKYRNLSEASLRENKKSDKLFIMGSGYSLNNITKEQWKEINNHDIFGFNFSFINNDHIPTFYTCEAMIPKNLNSENRGFVADIFFKLYKTKSEAYKNVIKIVSDLDERRLEHFENYGRDLFDENIFITKTANGIAKDDKQFAKLIEYYKKQGIFDEKDKLKEIFKFRGTLSMAICFGINMGYKEIILCGIDLTDPRYFYSDKDKYPNLPKFRSSKDTEKHATILENPLFISIEKVVKILNSKVCLPRNINLLVQNPESALSETIPVYKFKDHQHENEN